MASILSRTGRHRQRYQDNLRLVSGCIPYRLAKDGECLNSDLENRVEVLMISSPNRNDLVFPKGGWEDDETVEEAACREALEEAGVKGIIKENSLGVWEFQSKSRQEIYSLEGGCRGHMFAMEVTEVLEAWPEKGNRVRKWLHIKEAFKLCRYEWMCRALEEFFRVMFEDRKQEPREEVLDPHPISVPNVVIGCCYVKSSCTKHHLKVMAEDRKEDVWKEAVELYPVPVCDDVTVCQNMSTNCSIKPSSTEHHLRVMAEIGKQAVQEKIVDQHPVSVCDIVAECQIMSTNSCVKPSSTQHHNISSPISASFGVMLSGISL